MEEVAKHNTKDVGMLGPPGPWGDFTSGWFDSIDDSSNMYQPPEIINISTNLY